MRGRGSGGRCKRLSKLGSGQGRGWSLSDGAGALLPPRTLLYASGEGMETGAAGHHSPAFRWARPRHPFGLVVYKGAAGDNRIPRTLSGGLPSRPSCTQK